MRRLSALCVIAAGVFALVGCSASDDSACDSPSEAAVSVIANSVAEVNSDLELVQAYSAVSPEDDGTWFITASIEGEGMGDGVLGLWSTSSDPSQPGFSAAVDSANGEATFYSNLPEGSEFDGEPLVNDDGARSAQSCTLGNKPA